MYFLVFFFQFSPYTCTKGLSALVLMAGNKKKRQAVAPEVKIEFDPTLHDQKIIGKEKDRNTSSSHIENLSQLKSLNQDTLVSTLRQRYELNKIYTYCGQVLLAVNPYKKLQGLYGRDVCSKYFTQSVTSMPPHVYSIAKEAYILARKEKKTRNVTVLISGESGSGKTETAKIIMKSIAQHSSHLEKRSRKAAKITKEITRLVLESSPVLEFFGNAATLKNNNSSRFGKLVQLRLSKSQGLLSSAFITHYLLEKSRVTHQNPGERSYHVFYAMAAGGSTEQKYKWRLGTLSGFHYIEQSDHQLNELDIERFSAVVNSMESLGFTKPDIEDIFQVLAGILHIGNITFTTDGCEASRIATTASTMKACAACCELLQIDLNELENVLCKRVINVSNIRGALGVPSTDETYMKGLSCVEATTARDSLAMVLYDKVFQWIVSSINTAISPTDEARQENSIGILDVFGFEVFEKNGLEQLCINYCNERLQELFDEFIFTKEQDTYADHGIDWTYVEFAGNTGCLDLIENRPIGLISLLDETCMYPQGNDGQLYNKFVSRLSREYPAFKEPSRQQKSDMAFTIKHFASEVDYFCAGFVQKNRKELREESIRLITSSKHRLVCTLLDNENIDQKKVTSVFSEFKKQLDVVIEEIQQSHPLFIRCIKPNDLSIRDTFVSPRVTEQLNYSGVIQMVKIAQAGYPSRFQIVEFLESYSVLTKYKTERKLRSLIARSPEAALKQKIRNCLVDLDFKDPCDFQIGRSQVFLRQSVHASLELIKEKECSKFTIRIQRLWRHFKFKKDRKAAATIVQSHIRAKYNRKRWLIVRDCVVLLQRWYKPMCGKVIVRSILKRTPSSSSIGRHVRFEDEVEPRRVTFEDEKEIEASMEPRAAESKPKKPRKNKSFHKTPSKSRFRFWPSIALGVGLVAVILTVGDSTSVMTLIMAFLCFLWLAVTFADEYVKFLK